MSSAPSSFFSAAFYLDLDGDNLVQVRHGERGVQVKGVLVGEEEKWAC